MSELNDSPEIPTSHAWENCVRCEKRILTWDAPALQSSLCAECLKKTQQGKMADEAIDRAWEANR